MHRLAWPVGAHPSDIPHAGTRATPFPAFIPQPVSLLAALLFTFFGPPEAISGHADRPQHWPQFRGPGSAGVAESARPPVRFDRQTNLLWELPLPAGNSSPCIVADRIFLTGQDRDELVTLCVERPTGHLLWRRSLHSDRIEPFYPRLNSAASPTPACDGAAVFVYFGSFGLIAYDLAGEEKWRSPLPMPVTEFGTGTSPMLAGELLVLNCDQDFGSYLLAVHKHNGQTAWRTQRAEFPRGFGTPILWRHDQTEELVVPGTVWLTAYQVANGHERWRVRASARVVCTTPVAGDGLLFAASWSPGGDSANRISMSAFQAFAAENDRNRDGLITKDEIPPGPLVERFSQIDADKSGVITRAEWDAMRVIFDRADNCLAAIRPGGKGDITATHLAWKQTRGLPYVPSPLYYRGRVYLVKNGGLISCFEAQTGRPVYIEERLDALGDYYASPVAADGRIYLASQNGVIVVIAAADELRVLARNELGQALFATPALAGDALYVRTDKTLLAFGPPARLRPAAK